jgi:hypothetical protein
LANVRSALRIALDPNNPAGGIAVKEKAPVVKQLYRLSVEPRVIDQLVKLAARTGEPRSRLANRLFAEAVLGARLPPKSAKKPAA